VAEPPAILVALVRVEFELRLALLDAFQFGHVCLLFGFRRFLLVVFFLPFDLPHCGVARGFGLTGAFLRCLLFLV